MVFEKPFSSFVRLNWLTKSFNGFISWRHLALISQNFRLGEISKFDHQIAITALSLHSTTQFSFVICCIAHTGNAVF